MTRPTTWRQTIWAQRLMPRSIIAQIASLVAISVLLGIALVVAILWFLFDTPSRDDDPMFAVGRVGEMTRLVRTASSTAEADALLVVMPTKAWTVDGVFDHFRSLLLISISIAYQNSQATSNV